MGEQKNEQVRVSGENGVRGRKEGRLGSEEEYVGMPVGPKTCQ